MAQEALRAPSTGAQSSSTTAEVPVAVRRRRTDSILASGRYLKTLHIRDFRWIWIGSFISFMAMNMQMITRGWLVLRLENDSPLALVLVMVSFAAPMTVVSLVGGAT